MQSHLEIASAIITKNASQGCLSQEGNKLRYLLYIFLHQEQNVVDWNEELELDQSRCVTTDAMLSWQDLSVYAMDRNRRTMSKQLINNGI